MGDCCKLVGSFSKGTPKGIESTIGDLKTYIASPSHAQGDIAVLMISDVFGWQFVNNRVLADTYAEEAGVRVYLPDFFDGDHAPHNEEQSKTFDLGQFLGKHHPRQQKEVADRVARAIKSTSKVRCLIAGGYCWGAPAALSLGHEGGAADAVFFAHPSLTEDEDFEGLTKPGLFICAEHDHIFTDEKQQSARAITAKKANLEGDARIPSSWHTYLGTTHGFSVRGDENDPFTARAMRDAQKLVCNYFKSF
ncbi:alpha/beta-hydrolase [Wallemia mellicola]|nr:alpha/beta-hydrolase [Wallemia mellicola]TIB87333.1 alpha/beta-hydrolase [Wallemia mellicola]TIC11299.1 alpha/beta-hydrolase [Wallemia mellicola]TIC22927.1 alpha/beta-hydrolase [Wallemia mellicola]TIC39912.1 alpha/beta-hydrolase [Wallemia mellicola]